MVLLNGIGKNCRGDGRLLSHAIGAAAVTRSDHHTWMIMMIDRSIV